MVNVTLSVPEDVHKEMKRFSEVRWSEVARQAIAERLETLKLADRLARKSKLTSKDVESFGKMLKKGAAKRFMDEDCS